MCWALILGDDVGLHLRLLQGGGELRVRGGVWEGDARGGGLIENKHSTVVKTPPPPRACMSIHTEGNACSDIGRVLVLDGPPVESPPSATRLNDHSLSKSSLAPISV
jgi:hypothetical protein